MFVVIFMVGFATAVWLEQINRPDLPVPKEPEIEADTVWTSVEICAHCALKQTIWSIYYSSESKKPDEVKRKFEETVLSEELNSWLAPRCEHYWMTISMMVRGYASGTAIRRFDTESVREMVENKSVVKAITDYARYIGQHPRTVWRALAFWFYNKGTDYSSVFHDLPENGAETETIVKDWLKANYKKIENKKKASPPIGQKIYKPPPKDLYN